MSRDGGRTRRRRWLTVPAVLALATAAFSAVAVGQQDISPEARVEVAERTAGGVLRECPSVDENARPVTGGCVVKARGRTVFKIATPFGRLPLATCELHFTGHIASNGDVTLDKVATSGPNPCGDVRACREDTDPERKPWLGRIVPAGSGYEMTLDACSDTCAGWFEGPLTIALERSSRIWRASGTRAELGESGLELTGSWPLEGADLELKPVGGP